VGQRSDAPERRSIHPFGQAGWVSRASVLVHIFCPSRRTFRLGTNTIQRHGRSQTGHQCDTRGGLSLGLHIHYSKARRNDPYVTPVPDDRLHAVRAFTLASDVSPDAMVLPVQEDPAGCTLDPDRRLLKLGRELIEYDNLPRRAIPPIRRLPARAAWDNSHLTPSTCQGWFARCRHLDRLHPFRPEHRYPG